MRSGFSLISREKLWCSFPFLFFCFSLVNGLQEFLMHPFFLGELGFILRQ